MVSFSSPRNPPAGGNSFEGNAAFLCDLPVFQYGTIKLEPDCADIVGGQKHAVKLIYSALNQAYDQIEPDECKWEGITCNKRGNIINITLGKFVVVQSLC